MLSEKEKMLSGRWYHPLDKELAAMRLRARQLFHALNQSAPEETEERAQMLRELLPYADTSIWIEPPFYCDYGCNIITGEKVFLNFNCVLLDVANITIGSRTLIGPNVQIYTALHPMDFHIRAQGLERAAPITIGEDVWIGGSAIICPGVSIGHRSVIGAGSVITRDIPDNVFAAGNPCRVIRKL